MRRTEPSRLNDSEDRCCARAYNYSNSLDLHVKKALRRVPPAGLVQMACVRSDEHTRIVVSQPGPAADTEWSRLARRAALVTAFSLAATTLLYLLDALDLLGSSPTFHRTRHGELADQATFFAAFFNHQHHIWWDIALRDVLGPIGFLSLVLVSLGVANIWGWRLPRVQVGVAAFAFGAVFAIANSLIYLGELNYWRNGGWTASPAFSMVAIARAAEGIDHLTVYPEAFGFVLLAAGFACLGSVGHRLGRLSATTWRVCQAQVIVLLLLVLCSVIGFDPGYDVTALLAGLALGPWAVVALAQSTRVARRAVPAPAG